MLWVDGEISSSFLPVKICERADQQPIPVLPEMPGKARRVYSRRWRQGGPWRVRACQSSRWTSRQSCRDGLREEVKCEHDSPLPLLARSPLMTTCPFLRRAEHCMGKVSEAPAEACVHRGAECQLEGSARRAAWQRTCSKLCWCCSSSDMAVMNGRRGRWWVFVYERRRG